MVEPEVEKVQVEAARATFLSGAREKIASAAAVTAARERVVLSFTGDSSLKG